MKAGVFRVAAVCVLGWALAGSSCSVSRDGPSGPVPRAGPGGVALPLEEGAEADPRLVGSRARELIPGSSDPARDLDRDGAPDGWVAGNSPSLVRDSAVGWGPAGRGEGAAMALWVSGGRDMAGEWAAPLSGAEPGRTYVLSFFLFRKDFRNGWYPEIEVFGERRFLNQHASFGHWQPVELLVTAPEVLPDTAWFRFLNRFPCRFWMSRPSLRPYRLDRLQAGWTRSGAELWWEETTTDLVLKMELGVTDAEGKAYRAAFLNVDAADVWSRSTAGPAGRSGSARGADGVQGGLAWVPLAGPPPFHVRLAAVFDGRKIAEAALTLRRTGSASGPEGPAAAPSPLPPSPRSLPGDFFPIGIFDVPEDGAGKVQEAGFNTAHGRVALPGDPPQAPGAAEAGVREAAGLPGKTATAPGGSSLRWMLSALRGREPLPGHDLAGLKAQSRRLGIRGDRLLCLYAADEPELSGISPRRLHGFRSELRQAFPDVPTAAAVVRARCLPYYRFSADWFLLDPYPVPGRPLTWMSDSLDAAGDLVDQGRVMAVVQAFGGEENAVDGWGRFPTPAEMRTLAFLAVVHGARGLFFYNYPSAAGSEARWTAVKRVVGDLMKVYPWLARPGPRRAAEPWVLTPEGWKKGPGPVHSAVLGGRGAEAGVLVAVNPSAAAVEVRFESLWGDPDGMVRELLHGRPLVLKRGALIDSLPPCGVRVYGGVSP